jgi:hypothetical protein
MLRMIIRSIVEAARGLDNAAVKWAAKKRSGFADPSSTACWGQIFQCLP